MTEEDPRVAPAPLEAVPGLVREGAAHYAAGAFWEAHEAWERAWHALRAAGLWERAEFLQGMILATAAFENRKRDKEAGFKRQLANALHRLRAHRGMGASLGLADEAAWVEALVDVHVDACRHVRWRDWRAKDVPAPALRLRDA